MWHSVADHLALPIFFFYIGQELRLATREKISSLISPITAALFGMLVPAGIYLALAHNSHLPVKAFGAVIATDLPLVLMALAFIPSSITSKIRHYLLALAVADDLGSIIVLAIFFNSGLDIRWLSAQLAILLLLWFVRRKAIAATLAVLLSWWISLHTGLQPTVIAALMGAIVTIDSKRIFLALEKFSYYVCIPLFLVVTLTVGVHLDLSTTGLTTGLPAALILARTIGKPLGILIGFLIAGRKSLRWNEIGTVALMGTFGLSVSLLFIRVASDSALLASATKATIYINLIALSGTLIWGQILRRITS